VVTLAPLLVGDNKKKTLSGERGSRSVTAGNARSGWEGEGAFCVAEHGVERSHCLHCSTKKKRIHEGDEC
jgi:hypothetical protein